MPNADSLTNLFYKFSYQELGTSKNITIENLIPAHDQQYDKIVRYAKLYVTLNDKDKYEIQKLGTGDSGENHKRLIFFSLSNGKFKVHITGQLIYEDNSVRELITKDVEVFDNSKVSLTLNDVK